MSKRESWKNKIKKREKIGKDELERKKSILIGSSFRKEKTWIEKNLLNGTLTGTYDLTMEYLGKLTYLLTVSSVKSLVFVTWAFYL